MTTVTPPPNQAKQLPPGSKFPPSLITIQAVLDQFGTLERFQRQYGDIFYTPKSVSFPPNVIFSNPQAIEQVFTADPNLFEVNLQANAPIRVLLGDNSLILLDGKIHRKRRKLLLPPLHGERMKSYGQTMVDVTQEVVAQWQEGQTFAIHDYLQDISLQVILRTIFGVNTGKRLSLIHI